MPRLRRAMILLLLSLGGGYLLVAGLAFTSQRRLLFPAGPPQPVQIASATLLRIPRAGGKEVVAAHVPARPGAPTVVHFHGNGEQLADADLLAAVITRQGLGFLSVEFPGYGLMAGEEPSEAGLYEAADAALTWLHSGLGVAPAQTVLLGQSLGTGVATEMAVRGHGARLILISPYTSIVDVAGGAFPFLPVSLLLRDRFETAERAPSVRIPVLILHGDRDEVVPVQMGETLATLFPEAVSRIIEGRGHNDLFASGTALPALIGRFARGEAL